MPAPNPKRDKVLKYLRQSFPYKDALTSWDGRVYPYELVREAVYNLRDNGPEFLRVLHYYLFTPLSRTRIAEEVCYDASTVKRKLDIAADHIMQYLEHHDLPTHALFEVRDPDSREVEQRRFPKTFHTLI
jgi:hypothetical protein